MLLQKYEPRALREFAGNRQQAAEVLEWLRKRKKGALMLHGPSGAGKTLAVRLAAKELGFEIVERNASDAAGTVKESLLKSSRQRSIFSKGKIILIDDLEQVDSARDVAELIESSLCPVVLISSNPYDRKLAALRSRCRLVKFQKLRASEVESFLKQVCKAEGIRCEEHALKQLVRASNGDLRAALMDLEALAPEVTLEGAKTLGSREREDSIFETVRLIFKATGIESARHALAAEQDVLPWLEENIANEYTGAEEIAQAYDWLSKADIFRARIIRRQSWGLQKYTEGLAAFGVALSKTKQRAGFVQYKFPSFIRRKSEDEEIAAALHISKRKLSAYRKLLAALKV